MPVIKAVLRDERVGMVLKYLSYMEKTRGGCVGFCFGLYLGYEDAD